MNPKSGLIRSYIVSVEDNNGVYFNLEVLAVNPDAARVIGVAA